MLKKSSPNRLGKKSGPPPKSGPTPQGLNVPGKQVKKIAVEIKNGRD